ncbi:hypothetical protein [Neolewinella litorea]|uniref:Uncharacterized protein n=1 Tax=Neolewinella litorea TaxID=2562452 RepID=A0A4S4NE97_9BACT|nr:hypothetical protein [Neolewinella litorea]THH37856.1 hypothetical protein E4021_12515 [Neolewinella litorea]
MIESQTSREELKELLREILHEHPELILRALESAAPSESLTVADTVDYISLDEVREIVKLDFAKYDPVFRALA